MAKLWNSLQPLSIPTHDGSNQPTHPSIIDFLTEHNVSTWGGYRYWMAFTPYPNANDEHEDPNIVASHDGINWVVPNGLINPLDDLGGLNYNADTDMVFDPSENVLRVYYRAYLDERATGGNVKLELRMVKVFADMSYTAPIIIKLIEPWTQSIDMIRSQCIWRESETRWHMWANGGSRPYKFWYHFSEDGITWGNAQQCLDENGQDPFAAKGYENWHPSCKPNYAENRIEFFTVDFLNDHLLYSECPMDNPTLITLPLDDVVLGLGELGGWDDGRLYRPTFTIETRGNDYYYRLWYSGVSNNNVWNVGYTEGYLNRENASPLEPIILPVGHAIYFVRGKKVSLPLYKLNDMPNSPMKIYYNGQLCCFELADVEDAKASPARIYFKNRTWALGY